MHLQNRLSVRNRRLDLLKGLVGGENAVGARERDLKYAEALCPLELVYRRNELGFIVRLELRQVAYLRRRLVADIGRGRAGAGDIAVIAAEHRAEVCFVRAQNQPAVGADAPHIAGDVTLGLEQLPRHGAYADLGAYPAGLAALLVCEIYLLCEYRPFVGKTEAYLIEPHRARQQRLTLRNFELYAVYSCFYHIIFLSCHLRRRPHRAAPTRAFSKNPAWVRRASQHSQLRCQAP